MLKSNLVSSLEKAFFDQTPEDFKPFDSVTVLKNERLSFQLLYRETEFVTCPTKYSISVNEPFAKYATFRQVGNVPVSIGMRMKDVDDNYLRIDPGLYPDVLTELTYPGFVAVSRDELQSLWIEIAPQGKIPAGTYTLTVTLSDASGQPAVSHDLKIEILPAELPEQELIFTQWFHCDCLAQYYEVEVWSEEHWRIIENFAKCAVRNGVNMLLTPVHTPPLDTGVGLERMTTQLVDVSVNDGVYSFGFDKLDRWVDMCDRIGIKYFEIAHLFTQWGAKHAPKIMATVDGEYKKIFGWESDAVGEYTDYLRAFLPALLDHMKAHGNDKRCYFHISDEPRAEQIADYLAAKNSISDILANYNIMDALSSFEYYRQKVTDLPIPDTANVEPFLEAKVPGLWTYYCNSQNKEVANHLFSMPLWRTRSLGMQLYKFNIVGFLQWGFNFYNTQYSVASVNPFLDTCAGHWVPAGDAFIVYPAPDRTPYESIRQMALYEAFEDVRAMKLAEERHGHEKVVEEIEKIFGKDLRFATCAHDAQTLLAIRDRVNRLCVE